MKLSRFTPHLQWPPHARWYAVFFVAVFSLSFSTFYFMGDDEGDAPQPPVPHFLPEAKDAPMRYLLPVYQPEVLVTSSFGERAASRGFRAHKGIDLAPLGGGPLPLIVAAEDGVVAYSGWRQGYGNTIEIYHRNGGWTRYAHLTSMKVTPGKRVSRGEPIGQMGHTGNVVGRTGNHLHFEQIDPRGASLLPELSGYGPITAKGQHLTYAGSYYAIYPRMKLASATISR